MSKQRGFVTQLGELIDDRRARRESTDPKGNQSGRLHRFLRWLTPNGGTLLLVVALLVTARVWARPLTSSTGTPGPSATTVNYQGRLSDSDGVPLDGTYGMSFALYDAETDGNLVWGPEEHTAMESERGIVQRGAWAARPAAASPRRYGTGTVNWRAPSAGRRWIPEQKGPNEF